MWAPFIVLSALFLLVAPGVFDIGALALSVQKVVPGGGGSRPPVNVQILESLVMLEANPNNCSICVALGTMGALEVAVVPGLNATSFTTATTADNILYQICQITYFNVTNSTAQCILEVLAYNATFATDLFNVPPITPYAICHGVGAC